jgi:hypothetical protein
MKQIFTIAAGMFCIIACNNDPATGSPNSSTPTAKETTGNIKYFKGAFSNGMKGDSLSFNLSADGKKVSNLTFNGYWRCSGKLERQQYAGPAGTYDVANGKVDGHISEPPNGGSTAWRFDLKATIEGNKASGSFRMNINNLGCDTYLLKFEATAD